MKIAALAALACPLATHASSRIHRLMPFIPRKVSTHANNSVIQIPRGGDLGPISSGALAKTFGALAICDALTGTVDPIKVWGKLGIEVEPGSKGEHYMGHGMASSAASLATTSLLTLYDKTSVEEAIGYGFLARCAYMTESLLTSKYKELGVPTVPHVVIYLILLGTAFGLISGNSECSALAKVVSILLAGHGGLLLVNPRIEGDEETKKMAKVEGGYMFVSSIFAALLAFGMDPVKAMGYASILCFFLFNSILDLVADDEIFGFGTSTWKAGFIIFYAALAYGMLT